MWYSGIMIVSFGNKLAKEIWEKNSAKALPKELIPLATTGPEAVIVEFAATAPREVNTTFPPTFTKGVAIERVLVSAVVDLRVQDEAPLAVD